MEVAYVGVRTSKGCWKHGITELRDLAASSGMTDLWKNGITEAASRGNTEAQSAEMRIRGKPKNRIHGYLIIRVKPLMTEGEKKDAQVLELSYDFSCGIIRLYKYLNEGKLSMTDRDILMCWEGSCLGRQPASMPI